MLSQQTTSDKISTGLANSVEWVEYYTGATTAIGVCVLLYTLVNLPADWFSLLPFVMAAALVELTSVELYISSRSRVSVSTIIAIAAILVFGPAAGVVTHLSSGVMTMITTSLLHKQSPSNAERISILRRTAFNTSMLMISTLIAGWTYSLTGGIHSDLIRLGNIAPLLLAVSVDIMINICILMGIIKLQTGRPLVKIWRQEFAWGVPITLVGGAIGGSGLALGYNMLGAGGLAVFMLPVIATGYSFRAYVNNTRAHVNELEAMNQTLATVNKKLDISNLELLQALGAVVDAFDIYTYGHSTQVAAYGSAIAKKMGLSQECQEKILRGGLVHDIGKVGIKDAIIGKPGRLTDDEYEMIKKHPVIGAEIVSQMTGLHELVPMVRSHHERWDGSGYPDRLKGEEIPLDARILAVADSIDAMLSDRPYRSTRTIADVMKEVVRCSGTHYDPEVVKAIVSIYQSKGGGFFNNSARRVDRALESDGIIKPKEDARYLKKSMLETKTIPGIEIPSS